MIYNNPSGASYKWDDQAPLWETKAISQISVSTALHTTPPRAELATVATNQTSLLLALSSTLHDRTGPVSKWIMNNDPNFDGIAPDINFAFFYGSSMATPLVSRSCAVLRKILLKKMG
jgi:hypothetical protein